MEEKLKVLIIDDEESMRDSCSLILKKDGYLIDTAENGKEGLKKLEEWRPEFVLIDLKMPGIGGLEVLEKVKDIDPEIIPIVITGYATVDSAVEAMKTGAYDFLPKPFTPEELRIIIKRGLERRNLIKEAESLRKEKKLIEENFITMVTHQLRSPLVTIVQYFEVILGGIVGDIVPKQKEMLIKAKNRLEGLLELINDWLDIARLSNGKIIEKGKAVSIGVIVKKIVDFIRPEAEKTSISVEVLPKKGSDQVLGDEESLEQVFSNLIHNALKYNKPEGSISIEIEEREDCIATSVKDTGIGIPKEHLPLIFDQFYQVSRTGKKGKGSGLGLSIAKKIVDMHKGIIQVESQEGIGSTFTVCLPKSPEI
ncbi:MAG: response regulator [Candidatus Aminicenantes bacterium]|nr:response regulator [Candidatus Aminicenantes bacterium]